jgi:hypothetical protein
MVLLGLSLCRCWNYHSDIISFVVPMLLGLLL